MARGYKYLFKNIGFLTVGNFSSKVLTFLMVPLYTYVLTTEEYGTYDLLSNIIGLLVPILTVDISQSVIRFLLDKEADPEIVVSYSLKITLLSCIPITVLILVNYCFSFISILESFGIYFLAMYVLSALLPIHISVARGLDKVSSVAISGVLSTIALVLANILFLLCFGWGLVGYFLASIIGLAFQCLYLFLSTRMWRYVRFSKTKSSKLIDSMLRYCRPLIANDVSWWINNVSDRYIVTAICGVATNGLYSIAFRIPSILITFQNIFAGAWGLSAIQDFDPKDTNGFFKKTYATYNALMVILCSVLILFNQPISLILFAGEFYSAWIYVPFLLVATVFGGMAGYLGGIFNAVKDSKSIGISTGVGAAINLLLNLVLVQFFGALGAAVATLISYFLVWIYRFYKVRTYLSFEVHISRDYCAYAILVVQCLISLVGLDNVEFYLLEIFLMCLVMTLNRSELFSLLRKAKDIQLKRRLKN